MSITDYMQNEYKITPDATVVLDERANAPGVSTHHHVVIQWAGGEVWLDMSTFGDHHCIDISQMNDAGEFKGQGVFTIVQGRRAMMSPELVDESETTVTGHGWPGGYVVTLLTDPHGREDAVRSA